MHRDARNISLYKRGKFPTGLIPLVHEALTRWGKPVTYVDKRDHSKKIDVPSDEEIETCLSGITLRDYQVAGIKDLFTRSRGVVKAPTGSGKTLLAAGAIKIAVEKRQLRILFLTHLVELLHQTAKVIEKTTGIKPDIIGDGHKTFNLSPVSVGTVQTLHRGLCGLKDKSVPKGKPIKYIVPPDPEFKRFLEGVDFLIVDEAHRGDARMFQEVCDACRNTYYRMGLTATPLMKGDIPDAKLVGITGPLIANITIQDLIDRGLLAQPVVKLIRVKEPALPKRMKWQAAYTKGIVRNTYRNGLIVEETLALVKAGLQVLVLVTQLDHGDILWKQFARHCRCAYINGKDESEVRQAAIEGVKKGKIQVLISSTILDEGVDMPSIGAVILAGGQKSPIRVYQRIGRGMRPKGDEQNMVFVVDFLDLTQRHLAMHTLERYKLIKGEPSFKIVENFEPWLKRVA